MKPRRIVITIEVESKEKIADLKQGVKDELEYSEETRVIQIQANVIKKE